MNLINIKKTKEEEKEKKKQKKNIKDKDKIHLTLLNEGNSFNTTQNEIIIMHEPQDSIKNIVVGDVKRMDDDFDGPLEFYGFDLDYNNEESQNESNRNEEEEKKSKVIIAILIVVGIICQPIYLMFYVLYGLMECYRRFNCWFYYVDY